MPVTISGVEPGSIAEKNGIGKGDTLLAIDGHDIHDVLDYRFYMTARHLTLRLQRDGEAERIQTVTKDEYDDLGLAFDTYLMDKQRFCKNKCVFCFIDQMPKGMRDSLYFKDDDSRMSFLFGNYITLTNLEEWDIQRIIDMRISPVNISVHTTNPALRVEMMKNPHAGKALEIIPRFTAAGIKINVQLVLCPGVNDGAELVRSLEDLTALAPNLQSVAVVPVGLTAHREGLASLRSFTKEEAVAVVDTLERFGDDCAAKHGMRICFAADEFYLASGRSIPEAAFYEEFAQLENGVGLLSLLWDEFQCALEDTEIQPTTRHVTIATGKAAYGHIRTLMDAAQARYPGLQVDVVPICNDFFGHAITVAGLVTGRDLLAQLAQKELGDALIIPAVMLRREGDLFLDDISVETVQEKLEVPVLPVKNDGYELLEAVLGLEV